mmetsp:Transcript_8511/g.8625  ORF Transcript_8511/g.8625 Transcript_8511/m.8625 type:complete len:482 (+) Transcript_8511:100-1545(+)
MSASIVQSGENEPEGFSFMVAIAFTLNYIMGTGFLTLPWAFYEAGLGAGVFILSISCLVAVISVFFILESIARGEMLEEHAISLSGKVRTNYQYDSINKEEPNDRAHYIVDELKIEIPELCELFLGMNARRLYTLLISIYMYGSLWAYSTVFANALAVQIPLPLVDWNISYCIYLVVFGMIVVPSSCLELKEQVFFQVLLAWGRVIMVILMVVTTAAAHLTGLNPFDLADAPTGTDVPKSDMNHSLVNPSRLYLLIPIAFYANIFHHSIPALSEPVRDKSQLGAIYATTLVLCFFAYSAISILIATFFGSDTKSSSNLNWETYAEGTVVGGMISFFIVLFPALDVASAFPLNAITLGNNLMSFYYREQMHFVEGFRLNRVRFRVIASLPSVIAALFITDISMITNYTGLTGFVMALIFPALLSFYSRRKLLQLGLPTNTRYSSILTSTFSSIFTIVFSVSLIVFVLYSLTSQNFSPFAGPT